MSEDGKTAVLLETEKTWRKLRVMGATEKFLGLKTTISSRGQITIPRQLIRQFGLMTGDKIRFVKIYQTPNGQRLTGEAVREGKRLVRIRILIRQLNTVIRKRIPES